VARWLFLLGLLLMAVSPGVGAGRAEAAPVVPVAPVVPGVSVGAVDGEAARAGVAIATGIAARIAAAELDARDAYRLELLRMKAYLSVARALLQLRAPGAERYVREPLQEIFRDTQGELERRGAPFTADFLQQLDAVPTSEPAAALATIDSAVFAIDASFAQTGAMDANSVLAVVEALLREAVARYGDAVIDNEVVDLADYQSGRGFVTEAEALVRYAGALRERPGHEALVRAVTLIRQAWPGVVPPPIVFDPASVAGRLDEAVAAMDELR